MNIYIFIDRFKAAIIFRIQRCFMLFQAWRHRRIWEYGTFNKGSMARRHRIARNVQFILWMPGEQGHKKPYWHNSDSSWWDTFKSKENV